MKIKNKINKEIIRMVKMNTVLLILLAVFVSTTAATTCNDNYYYKEGVINGSSDFGGIAKWNGSDFAAFWFDKIYPLYDTCKENEYLKISQSNLNSTKRIINIGNMTYYTKRIITPYMVFNQTGKDVEYALDKNGYKVVNGGFYARISCFGRSCVAINGNSSRIARLLLEHTQQDSDIKIMTTGEDWELEEGWNITISDITDKRATIKISKDGIMKDIKIVKEGDVYTYTKKQIIDENDVPVFVTYIYNITTESSTDIVKLKYSWLMSDDAISIIVGDSPSTTSAIIGGPTGVLTTTKVDKYGIEMKNSNQDVLLSSSAIIKLIDNIYIIVKDKSYLSYLPIMIRNDITPPYRVTGLSNISYAERYINWTWTDPGDYDFEKVMIYLGGVYKGDVQKGVKYYNATGLSPYTSYTIGTRTVDISGNIGVWHNRTRKTAKELIPPESITELKNITYKPDYINWTWIDPKDTDFAKVMIYIDGVYKGDVLKGRQYYSITGMNADTLYNIGTHTVDIYDNVNLTWVNHSTRTAPDITPPYRVSNLTNISYADRYIDWTWNDPSDSDFEKVMIYLNGVYKGDVLKGIQYHRSTGLSPYTSYTIGTRTVDISGNIGVWHNRTRKTAKDLIPPESITELKNVTYKPDFINWTWIDPKDTDFAKVMIYIDGVYKGDVLKGRQYYSITGMNADTLYNIGTHTVDIYDNVNLTWVNHSTRTAPGIIPHDSIYPESITNLHDITYTPTYINWTWKDPEDSNLSGILIYLNGVYKENVPKGRQYYNVTNLMADTLYNIGTHTIGVSGNINQTWINHSTKTALLDNRIKFITVGDPHIDDSDSGPGSSQDLLQKVVSYINRSDADFAVILGDTARSDTDVGDFDVAQNILTNINKTHYIIPGNHDVGFDNDSTNYESHFGPMAPIINIKGYQLLFVGIWQEVVSKKEVIHWRFNFSEADKEKPTIVFLHGAVQNSPSGACFGWNGSTRYFKYGYSMQPELDKFTKLIGVYSAHVHSDSDQTFSTPLVPNVRYTTIDGLVRLGLGSCDPAPNDKVGYSIVQDGKLSYSQTPYDIFTSGMIQQMMTRNKELDKEEIEYMKELETGEVS